MRSAHRILRLILVSSLFIPSGFAAANNWAGYYFGKSLVENIGQRDCLFKFQCSNRQGTNNGFVCEAHITTVNTDEMEKYDWAYKRNFVNEKKIITAKVEIDKKNVLRLRGAEMIVRYGIANPFSLYPKSHAQTTEVFVDLSRKQGTVWVDYWWPSYINAPGPGLVYRWSYTWKNTRICRNLTAVSQQQYEAQLEKIREMISD